MTWLPPGSRKPVLVYLLLNQFCKEQKAQQMPPTPSQPLCSLCKSDLSRRRSCIKHCILLSGKINTLFNSFLLYSAWGTMKLCSVLSTKVTGANHLTAITHCIQVNLESWGLWQGWCVLWVQWALSACPIPPIPARTFQLWLLQEPHVLLQHPVPWAMARCVLALRKSTCSKTTSLFLNENLLSVIFFFTFSASYSPMGSELWYLFPTAPVQFLGIMEVKGCWIWSYC